MVQKLRKVGIAAIVMTSLYLLVAPIAPLVEYYIRDYFDLEYDSGLSQQGNSNGSDQSDEDLGGDQIKDTIKGNTVVIPKIGVKMPIVLGQDESALDQGSWMRPKSSTPPEGSNTVLTAHRFSYLTGGKSFYNLDKLKSGDEVLVYWEKQKYRYVVSDSFVVMPDAVEIEAATDDPLLTLYTCTPLWTASKRLVVTAVPDEKTLALINQN